MEINGNKKSHQSSPDYRCEKCNYVTVKKNNYEKHLLTLKHNISNIGNKKSQQSSPDYRCEKCNYVTVRKCDYDKHTLTLKHKNATSSKKPLKECNHDKPPHTYKSMYECENCNKIYQTHPGLWKHKKKCSQEKDLHTVAPEMVLSIIHQFKDLLLEQNKVILDLCKNTHNSSINNSQNTTNSNNKKFNLNFFLNETCKDAMNISDFAKSIVLQLTDIVDIGECGYVKGMSNIIISNLNSLEENKRPIHCTDVKREVVYVKDEDKWEKDTNKEKMRILIKKMDRKLAPLMISYSNNHKKEYRSDTEIIKHQQVMYELVGGKNDESDNEDDIIRNISKKMVIARG